VQSPSARRDASEHSRTPPQGSPSAEAVQPQRRWWRHQASQTQGVHRSLHPPSHPLRLRGPGSMQGGRRQPPYARRSRCHLPTGQQRPREGVLQRVRHPRGHHAARRLPSQRGRSASHSQHAGPEPRRSVQSRCAGRGWRRGHGRGGAHWRDRRSADRAQGSRRRCSSHSPNDNGAPAVPGRRSARRRRSSSRPRLIRLLMVPTDTPVSSAISA